MREQLAATVDKNVLDNELPAWGQLSDDARAAKVAIARDELLRVLDRAGYQIHKKKG